MHKVVHNQFHSELGVEFMPKIQPFLDHPKVLLSGWMYLPTANKHFI